MTNAELMATLRYCGNSRKTGCKGCPLWDKPVDACFQIVTAAADALEADEKRIAELDADKKTLINVVKDKSDFHATKDAMRIAELEAQLPKEGEWIHGRELGKEWLYDHWVTYFEDWRCSNCGVVFEQESKPKYHYCPNCGARMKGEQE